MPKDGSLTKEKIMDAAEALVLDHGYGATSIDQILEKTGITKGAFFYHFKSKAELAQALVARYVKRDDDLLFSLTEKAEKILGMKPARPLRESMKKTIDWYTDNEDWWRKIDWMKNIKIMTKNGKMELH